MLKVPATSRRRRAESGFTLAEVVAALLFMAIVIPVAVEGLRIAGRAGEVAVRKDAAARVADRLLNEQLVLTNWSQATQSGVIREGTRDYRWTLRNENWNQDAMQLLSVEVIYEVQGQEYTVSLSTLAPTQY